MLPRRGIAAREAGRKHADGRGSGGKLDIITTGNVHCCTTYELRQELKRRGHFLNDYSGKINYQILLEKLVLLLQEEQAAQNLDRFKIIEKSHSNRACDGERLVRERAERKTEAMERSRLRQMNKNYFASKKAANTSGKVENSFEHLSQSSSDISGPNAADQEVKEYLSQPFARKFRPKVSG